MPSISRSSTLPRPTEAELAILRTLWERGPLTVRAVMEALNENREPPIAYTTALKLMQILFEKGLLHRDETNRTHIYRPSVQAEKTKRQMVTDLMDRLFDGSALEMVTQALGAKKINAKEMTKIRELINNLGEDKP